MAITLQYTVYLLGWILCSGCSLLPLVVGPQQAWYTIHRKRKSLWVVMEVPLLQGRGKPGGCQSFGADGTLNALWGEECNKPVTILAF
jgi:hypothetical protein